MGYMPLGISTAAAVANGRTCAVRSRFTVRLTAFLLHVASGSSTTYLLYQNDKWHGHPELHAQCALWSRPSHDKKLHD